MRSNPERVAWIILLSAFAIFCCLAISIPLGARWIIVHSYRAQPADVLAIDKLVRYSEAANGNYVAILAGESAKVKEGSTIITDADSGAFITFFEDSTARLYNNTRITIQESRTPRYSISPSPHRLTIRVTQGRITIGTAPPIDRNREFVLLTPHASIALQEGRYSAIVTQDRTEITVVLGQAQITAAGATLTLDQGQYVEIPAGQPPSAPRSPGHDLIVNGDFTEPLELGWSWYHINLDPEDAPGKVREVTLGGKRALLFSRTQAETHGETGIVQKLNVDVRDFHSLYLRCEVRVDHQSLPGGGTLSSEFPIIIKLSWIDVYGNPQFRTWGFYALDPREDDDPGNDNWPIVNGEKIPSNVWWLFETPNMMDLSDDSRPARLTELRIYASGWDYQSAVANVQLIAAEVPIEPESSAHTESP